MGLGCELFKLYLLESRPMFFFPEKTVCESGGVGFDSSTMVCIRGKFEACIRRTFFLGGGLANFGGRPAIEGGLDSSKYGMLIVT